MGPILRYHFLKMPITEHGTRGPPWDPGSDAAPKGEPLGTGQGQQQALSTQQVELMDHPGRLMMETFRWNRLHFLTTVLFYKYCGSW